MVTCCICEKQVNIQNSYAPGRCFIQHGQKAHRICENCWWDPITGFALENMNHSCPGCQKGMKLTELSPRKEEVIVISDD